MPAEMDVTQPVRAAARWFRFDGRLAPRPAGVAAAARCVCGGHVPAAARFCPHCGGGQFRVGASDEVELPAGRTVTVAAGMMMVRYDPASPRRRWRDAAAGPTGGDAGPAILAKIVGEPDRVLPAEPLAAMPYPTRGGLAYELTVLDLAPDAARVLVRRTA